MSERDLPRHVIVSKLLSSRYADTSRPEDWDERKAGSDIILSEHGDQIKLLSDGGQSPPKVGWKIVLISGTPEEGFRWTLYGISRSESTISSGLIN